MECFVCYVGISSGNGFEFLVAQLKNALCLVPEPIGIVCVEARFSCKCNHGFEMVCCFEFGLQSSVRLDGSKKLFSCSCDISVTPRPLVLHYLQLTSTCL